MTSVDQQPKNILALTRYGDMGASSRVRTRQFIPRIQAAGFNITRQAMLSDKYVQDLYRLGRRSADFLPCYLQRLAFLLANRRWDLLWIEKEVLPWLPTWIERLLTPNAKMVIDYDDAVFHTYDQSDSWLIRTMLGDKCDRLMSEADLVVVGSHYLRDRSVAAGARRTELIPSVVDCNQYVIDPPATGLGPVIGWIGSPSTEQFLYELMEPFRRVCMDTGARLHLIGVTPKNFDAPWITCLPWSEGSEARDLAQIDIGIMPLSDGPWERGKCGYKLIQYMAAGKPVVASPVGENPYIVRQGENGFLAEDESQWESHLTRLIRNEALRKAMGKHSRKLAVEEYSLEVASRRLISLFADLTAREA